LKVALGQAQGAVGLARERMLAWQASTDAAMQARKTIGAAGEAQMAMAAVQKQLRQMDPRKTAMAIAMLQEQVRRMNPARNSFAFRRALNDPALQVQTDQMIQAFIAHSSSRQLWLGQKKQNTGELGQVIYHLGPEAIPSLVRGLNLAARYNLGFC
jgi:hypothetical protein